MKSPTIYMKVFTAGTGKEVVTDLNIFMKIMKNKVIPVSIGTEWKKNMVVATLWYQVKIR